MTQRVFLADLPEKEVKRDGGPLGGLMQEWDPFNAEELKVLRQVKAWMSDQPGLFECATNDMLATFLRGYMPLVNAQDHTFARMFASLKWRAEEQIDTALTAEGWVSAAAAKLFDEAFPCGPIGRDQHGHVVVVPSAALSNPGDTL